MRMVYCVLTWCVEGSKGWSRCGKMLWGRTIDGTVVPDSLSLVQKHWCGLYMAAQTHFLRTQSQSHHVLLLVKITEQSSDRLISYEIMSQIICISWRIWDGDLHNRWWRCQQSCRVQAWVACRSVRISTRSWIGSRNRSSCPEREWVVGLHSVSYPFHCPKWSQHPRSCHRMRTLDNSST